MSNPKFSIGQHVAVYVDLTVVIPIAKIIDHEFYPIGVTAGCARTGNLRFHGGGHYYLTDSDRAWMHENYLRPYTPGEYTEDAQDIHAPIEEGAQ